MLALTRVMGRVIGIKRPITLITPVRPRKEAFDGCEAVKMVFGFQQEQDMTLLGGVWVQELHGQVGEDLELNRRVLSGQKSLKFIQLLLSARSFGNACLKMKFFGQDAL